MAGYRAADPACSSLLKHPKEDDTDRPGCGALEEPLKEVISVREASALPESVEPPLLPHCCLGVPGITVCLTHRTQQRVPLKKASLPGHLSQLPCSGRYFMFWNSWSQTAATGLGLGRGTKQSQAGRSQNRRTYKCSFLSSSPLTPPQKHNIDQEPPQ